jgi:hypothetical protein
VGSVPIHSEWGVHGPDGEKAEAPSTPRIIPIVGSEMPLHFSSMVQLARCQSIHLALSIFNELG